MNPRLSQTIQQAGMMQLTEERKAILQPLIAYIANKVNNLEEICLNFICTHNSRRSHLSQIWAQTMAYHHGIKDCFCYSGGTEVTALYPKVATTLVDQGFQIASLSSGSNPVYVIKYQNDTLPIIGFSKVFDDLFNPTSKYAAIMTCSAADEGCPFIAGAEKRFPIRYADPKVFDGTDQMDEKYAERSLEIASELFYVFSKIKQ
jgi:arsenate reductase